MVDGKSDNSEPPSSRSTDSGTGPVATRSDDTHRPPADDSSAARRLDDTRPPANGAAAVSSAPVAAVIKTNSGTTRHSNWVLIRWMTGMGLQYPGQCFQLLSLQLILLSAGLISLTLIGLQFDVIRHALDPANAPQARGPMGLTIPMAWQERPYLLVCILAGVTVLASGCAAMLRFLTVTTNSRLIQRIMIDLRTRVYDKLQRLSFRFFDSNETGSIINRATSDVTAIANFAEFALIQVFVLIVTLMVSLVYMISIHPLLTLVSMATTPLLVLYSIYFSRKVRPAHEENRRLYDRVILTLSENIQGQHVVKGFAIEDDQINRFHAANDNYRAQQRWLFKQTSLYAACVGFMTQINLIIVLLFGGYLVISQSSLPRPSITVGNLIVFAALLTQFSNQVINLTNLANTLQASLTAAGRVKEVLDAPLEITNAPGAVSLPKARGVVEFRGVTFAYKPNEPVLRNVSLKVEPGQCVAILGATGAGKSTLLSLITRFYDPQKGQVLIDGIDARDIRLDDLRRNIGLVFQESFLFSNTVAKNIAFGHPEATREQIENAAKIAAAHDFIMELEKGYDTVIGEYGSNLSGGQRQRLAIARALLLEPSILILDDATAAIDPETEHEILQAMDNAMRGRTTFVVAHRLSTLRRADLIVVMDRGRIIQAGKHEDLMQRSGQYSSVAKLQVVDRVSQTIIQARRWYNGEVDSLLPDEGDAI